jgi:hypothetical protein
MGADDHIRERPRGQRRRTDETPPLTPESVEPSVEYDAIDEASLESMPASDPPARGVTRVGEPRRPCDPVPRAAR